MEHLFDNGGVIAWDKHIVSSSWSNSGQNACKFQPVEQVLLASSLINIEKRGDLLLCFNKKQKKSLLT